MPNYSELSEVRRTLDLIQKALIVLSAAGLLGLGFELVLVNHWYLLAQLIPFVAIGGAVACMLLYLLHERMWTLRLLRLVGWLLILTGLVGAYFHLKYNPALIAAGHPNISAVPLGMHPSSPTALGLPHIAPSPLSGPAPVSAPLAMSGLGVILLLALVGRHRWLIR
jgi:hypothetical protein